MPDYGVHANFEAHEGTVNGEETIQLNRKSRKILIVNDHATNDLLFKFNDSEDFGTLKGTESLSIYFYTNKIILDGTNVPYRISAYG